MTTWIRRFGDGEIERLRATVSGTGSLAGATFAVKDNLDVEGVATTAGCKSLEHNVAVRTSASVALLMDAGAVPVGKTNMDQFATGLVGTRTPYGIPTSVTSMRHVSGGSSSGSAVAVATGEVDFALGTDTAGSGRVPAAFNGIVGVKPTRGLISTTGLLPACRSLDCVTTFTRTVADARPVLEALIAYDPADSWSRRLPACSPDGVASVARVVGVPSGDLGLDPHAERAWRRAVDHARTVAAHVIEVDVTAFLDAAALLYSGPWLAQRWAALRPYLTDPTAMVDPIVEAVVRPGADISGAEVFDGFETLATLQRTTESVWPGIDALLMPAAPTHPTFDEVAADPIGVNAQLGRFTNFVNLLDLCAIAVPAGSRDDGLPFGVQLIGPAFADAPLLELAARWLGEPSAPPPVPPGWSLVAVAGAHLCGQPLNPALVALGARFRMRARTAAGYRMYALPGEPARPGLVRTGDGPAGGQAVEVWELPHQGVGALLSAIGAPLGLGRVVLDDGSDVCGFLAEAGAVVDAVDISEFGGWRDYLAATPAAARANASAAASPRRRPEAATGSRATQ
jgi:allophanate hydrolase